MRERIIVSNNKRYTESKMNSAVHLNEVIEAVEGKRVWANRLCASDLTYAINESVKTMRNHGKKAPYDGLTIEVSGCECHYAKAYKKYSRTAQTTVGTCKYHGGRWYLVKVERVTDYIDRLQIGFRVIN